ncbi:hypothetical protein F4560_006808 [Saccharothrix ecbatanensis]|uniref:Uncharacterized protein n=1 Tax=Saccharothrix ecbatanensis TaxID=1105145 RepID=A0A7W9M4F1_9PSEU|nr:ABC transporter permease [Saccharothrix ecbatanensis]MBB5807040.1 hypothetical protein [Saccharothrix ecbatanensis]
MTSAYPTPVDTLTEKVKARAIELGEMPSRNRIKTEFKVGAPKATAVLAALTDAGFDPTRPEVADVEVPARRLHAVPSETTPATPVTEEPRAQASLPLDTQPVAVDSEVTEVATPVQPDAVSADTGDESPAADTAGARDETPPAGKRHQSTTPDARVKPVRSWPLLLLAVGAFVAIWGGWVGLGELTGFGPIRLLPGIADGFVINSAITLPIGVEAYAAYALRVWLSGGTRSVKARRFARASAIGSLVLGAAGQVAYHLMVAAGITVAPWWITTFVSCLPVVVLGCGAALTHLLHDQDDDAEVTR